MQMAAVYEKILKLNYTGGLYNFHRHAREKSAIFFYLHYIFQYQFMLISGNLSSSFLFYGYYYLLLFIYF
jgi:hypothetical protein